MAGTLETMTRPIEHSKREAAAAKVNRWFTLGKRRWLAGCLLLIHALAQPARAEPLEGAPSFWDPKRRIEKPDTSAQRTLRFITEDDYPPFDFVTADGSLMGFNVEIARALCDELRAPCTVQTRRWDTIADTIVKNGADAAVASLAINAANRARLDFTTPYYKTPGRFVARVGARIPDPLPETLAGKIVGVEAHTAHEAFLRDLFPKTEVRAFDNATALRSAIRRGDVDIVFGDGVALALWLNGTDAAACCAFVGGAYTDAAYFGDGVGIAVAKGASLRVTLDYGLKRLSERGVLSELYLKYFPLGFF